MKKKKEYSNVCQWRSPLVNVLRWRGCDKRHHEGETEYIPVLMNVCCVSLTICFCCTLMSFSIGWNWFVVTWEKKTTLYFNVLYSFTVSLKLLLSTPPCLNTCLSFDNPFLLLYFFFFFFLWSFPVLYRHSDQVPVCVASSPRWRRAVAARPLALLRYQH